MQVQAETLQEIAKKCKKLFLGLFDGNFTELFEIFHELKSGLAGAGASSFVTLYDLGLSVLCILGKFSSDFFNKCFHFVSVLVKKLLLYLNSHNFVQDMQFFEKKQKIEGKIYFFVTISSIFRRFRSFIAKEGPAVTKVFTPAMTLSQRAGICAFSSSERSPST